MKIIEKSKDFSAKEIYRMTEDRNVRSVKDVPDNEIINAMGYVTFEDTNAQGDTTNILAIIGADDTTGEEIVWACQSATFKRSFFAIVNIAKDSGIDMNDEPLQIQKLSGVTKSGRDYVDCRWV